MPPRTRKVDPAQLRLQFEEWKKSSDEWASWEKLLDARREIHLTATSPDILIDMSKFLDDLWRLASILKVPRKSQGYEQIYLKIAFFSHADMDNKLEMDGLKFEFVKSSLDIAGDLRNEFIKVLSGLELFTQLDAENFISHKKDLVKKLTSFEKAYMAHAKKAHDYILNSILLVILKPLSEALEANMNLYYLQYRDHIKKKWFRDPAPDFRIKACRERFAVTMRDLIIRLKEHGPLRHVPDIMKSLSRLEIDTSSHPVLKCFVSPVKKAWRKLRSVMKEKYKRGLVHYRIPVCDNVEIVEALKDLIDVDERAEQLLGDSLKKDQLEFIYDVLNHIKQSPLGEELNPEMKETDKLKVEIIPQLATFKALQQMYQANEDIRKRERELSEVGLDLEAAKPGNSAGVWNQDKEIRYEGIKRVWVWENFIRDFDKPFWSETSEEVAKVNLMVQEDLADFLIARHIKQKLHPGEQETRPPYVWNHYLMHNRYVKKEEPLFKEDPTPEAKVEKKKFRAHVKPQDYYLDGRIQRLIEKIENLAIGLKTHQSGVWNFLISNVIEAMKENKPESGAEDISTDEELKNAEEVKEEVKADA